MLTTRDQSTVLPATAGTIAPGHRYDPQSGSGIEWTPDVVRLWLRRAVIAQAPAPDGSRWDFWYGLRFAAAFPAVSHWWFGSPWTGRVRLWAPAQLLGGGLSGMMQFVDEDSPILPWTVWPGLPPRVATPMPPLHAQAINLPLRRVLAGYAAGVINGLVAPGAWRVASSLVACEDLAAALPVTKENWSLAGTSAPPRQALCELQAQRM